MFFTKMMLISIRWTPNDAAFIMNHCRFQHALPMALFYWVEVDCIVMEEPDVVLLQEVRWLMGTHLCPSRALVTVADPNYNYSTGTHYCATCHH